MRPRKGMVGIVVLYLQGPVSREPSARHQDLRGLWRTHVAGWPFLSLTSSNCSILCKAVCVSLSLYIYIWLGILYTYVYIYIHIHIYIYIYIYMYLCMCVM